jgi:starch synthase
LILALDTAFSTFVSTDRLDPMRRSAMARTFCWDLSVACYSPPHRKTVST